MTFPVAGVQPQLMLCRSRSRVHVLALNQCYGDKSWRIKTWMSSDMCSLQATARRGVETNEFHCRKCHVWAWPVSLCVCVLQKGGMKRVFILKLQGCFLQKYDARSSQLRPRTKAVTLAHVEKEKSICRPSWGHKAEMLQQLPLCARKNIFWL